MHAIEPLPQLDSPWSNAVQNGFQILNDIYRSATTMLHGENYNLHRLRATADIVFNDALPVFREMHSSANQERLPMEWINNVGLQLSEVINKLIQAEANLTSGDQEGEGAATSVHFVEPVTLVRTGKRGRPRKNINLEFLQEAIKPNRRIPLTTLAATIGVHRNTLTAYLKRYKLDYSFSNISDSDLDTLVHQFRSQYPESGLRYLAGFIRRHGLRVQRHRVTSSLARVDPLGQALRRRSQKRIARRIYSVARPNALWHIDGHHKLIHWGIVIHGAVDGYSRAVVGLKASNNNRSATVLSMFVDAVIKYGCPSRVRGDRGGENKDVAVLMILIRGPRRASFMWGSSTHNTRIERLWVEIGSQFARRWRAFFLRLERLHGLNRQDPDHLWLLHYLFLAAINSDCEVFQQNWNEHPISGAGHNQSPNDLRFIGQVQHGIYSDDLADIHPDTLCNYYGVDRLSGHDPNRPSGAGHPPDEDSEADDIPIIQTEDDSDTWEDIPRSDQIAADIQDNFHDAPVAVPTTSVPFQSEAALNLFQTALVTMSNQGFLPIGYGIRAEEWEDSSYPVIEVIRTGKKRGGKEIRMSLPYEIWLPRAEVWTRALSIMENMIADDY